MFLFCFFQIGSQNPDHASAKETRAIVAHQYAERRSMIKSTIMSYATVLPASWLPTSFLPEASAAAAPVTATATTTVTAPVEKKDK